MYVYIYIYIERERDVHNVCICLFTCIRYDSMLYIYIYIYIYIGLRMRTWFWRKGIWKGTNAVSTNGVTQLLFVSVDRGTVWVPICQNMSTYIQFCVHFSPICQNSLLLQRPHQCRPHLSAAKVWSLATWWPKGRCLTAGARPTRSSASPTRTNMI